MRVTVIHALFSPVLEHKGIRARSVWPLGSLLISGELTFSEEHGARISLLEDVEQFSRFANPSDSPPSSLSIAWSIKMSSIAVTFRSLRRGKHRL